MGRTALHKRTPSRSGFGNARPAEWTNGTDLTLRGSWLHPTKKIRIEVPIFQHAFYPKKDHTDLDIRQNVTYRMIELPSVHELRMHGIDAEKAAVISEVSVHPRHIKNDNYFRTDFPAVAKQVAKIDDTVLIFPANDMPTARLKRKKVLSFLRMSFTPLFIKKRLYTSGRISMYFVAPPGATKNLSRSLNLEAEDEKVRDSIAEWYPTHSKRPPPRKRGPRKPKPRFTPRQERIATDVLRETSIALQRDVMPIVTDKLEISQHSKPAKEIEDWLGKPATSRELLRRTNRGGRGAVKTWVNQVMIPRMKEIVKDEVAAAADATGRWIVRQMLTAVVSMVVDSAKESRVGKSKGWTGRTLQKIEISPADSGLALGAAEVYMHQDAKRPTSKVEQERRIIERVQQLHSEATGDFSVDIKRVYKITINPNADTPVKITLDEDSIKKGAKFNPYVMGKFATSRGSDSAFNKVYYDDFAKRLLPDISQDINEWYRNGMPSSYSSRSRFF